MVLSDGKNNFPNNEFSFWEWSAPILQTHEEVVSKIKELKQRRSRVGKKDTFFSDVIAEMRLVRWPSRKEMVKYSLASLFFVLFFALFFFGFDALFALVKDLVN